MTRQFVNRKEDMKRMMRAGLVAALAIAGIAIGTTDSASAKASGGVFNGTASINCFGCGTSSGTAALKVSGVLQGKAGAQKALSASYTVSEASATCPAVGTANGSFSGAVSGSFTWTRVGATAVITTSGGIKGAGIAAFAVKKPVGLPCGGPVTAVVAGSVAGT
jgi:hypothetical protein